MMDRGFIPDRRTPMTSFWRCMDGPSGDRGEDSCGSVWIVQCCCAISRWSCLDATLDLRFSSATKPAVIDTRAGKPTIAMVVAQWRCSLRAAWRWCFSARRYSGPELSAKLIRLDDCRRSICCALGPQFDFVELPARRIEAVTDRRLRLVNRTKPHLA
jgi:hypothetical protein